MKKTLLGITSCLLLTILTTAEADCRSTLEVRGAAFFPMSHDFRKIYGDVGVDLEVEFSTRIFCCMEGWVNFAWFPKHGHVKSCGSSDIDIANLSLGIKSTCQICDCFYIYAGIGPTFGWVWIDNRLNCCSDRHSVNCCSTCTKKRDRDSEFAVGGIVKTGILYYFNCNLFLDLFVDYLYQPVHFHHRHVDVGGFRTGLGLGVAF